MSGRCSACGNPSFFVALSSVVFQKRDKTWRTANVSRIQEIDTGVTENGIEGKVGW
jgi:hypothetical protein